MAVSVIISNFNGSRFLPKLVGSLRAQRGVETEIVVVDRNSTDGSKDFLGKQKDFKVTSHPPEAGLVSGYSAGFALATHPHIFFCNEDLWLDSDCLARLEKTIDLDARVAATDPWQWTYDGKVWIHGVVRFRSSAWNWNSPYPFKAVDCCAPVRSSREIPYACAGAFMIHRAPFEEVGGWDTRFFLDSEDVDLGIRLWKARWKSMSVPEAKVYHAVNASNDHVLEDPGQTVRGKRYVSGRANIMMVQLKHLAFPLLPAVGFWWSAEVAKEIAKRDPKLARGAVEAGRLVVKNLPGVLRDRRKIGNRARGLAAFYNNPTFNERY